ncbi:MAG TPA: DUF4019 domain-containing protein [Chthoniobacterales bacterium]|nr:DUF4019 domain-containing protein [Chthoniobacterales bacterium]
MISKYHKELRRTLLPIGVTILVGLCTALQTKRVYADAGAEAKSAAAQAMTGWLTEIDQGKYEKSWQDASKAFREKVIEAQWKEDLSKARQPLGDCTARKLVSALLQTDVPRGGGQVLKGEFVIAQFDSSFANLKYAVETVTFQKESDGSWKAAGYYIKPGPGP